MSTRQITKTILSIPLARYASRITRYILLSIFLLPAISAWSGDLTVDNLTVSTNAVIYGNLNFYSIAGWTTNAATATGGTITTNGNYRIHTFTNSGIFTVSGGSLVCDVLIVAGGGGGGGTGPGGGGGGAGGGGYIYINSYSCSGEMLVTVGIGGSKAVSGGSGSDGSNSVFDTLTAIGGGGGGTWNGSPNGHYGGSGGGSAYSGTIGQGEGGQGNDGGAGTTARSSESGGGGGGAGAVGGNAGAAGGNGGTGLINSISGSETGYAGGGGGGSGYKATYGGSASCGGGAGASNGDSVGFDGTPFTGGGGGGGRDNIGTGAGGNGGSGIVIVRYTTNQITAVYSSTLMLSSNGINQSSTSGANTFMGKVGIGTNNPAEKLHVAGNVQVDGSLTLGGVPRSTWPSGAEGALMVSNNLSEISGDANKAAAREHLGLGSASTYDAGAFISTNGDASSLTNITAAQVTNAGALLAANNLSEISASASTARDNLGLGSAAISDTSAFDPAGAATTVSNVFTAHAENVSNPHQVTAAQAGALSTTGGVVNGSLDIQYIPPKGDLIMGSYTNQ